MTTNNTPKHTPGPWVAVKMEGFGTVSYDVRAESDDSPFGTYKPFYDGEAEYGQANAHLIAAAPDLLKECEEALARLETYILAEGVPREELPQQRRLMGLYSGIAKAKGQANG